MSSASAHTVHIPVMGTGFTIDAPLKVARFGISSVISLVDDVLIEQMRRRISELHDEPFEPIESRDDDFRARRITSYLDLLDRLVKQQVSRLRESVFTPDSELTRYYEMLPHSPLRSLYERMRAATDLDAKTSLQKQLRELVVPGSIDVNIMTKLDTDVFKGGERLSPLLSSAMSALRGFAQSTLSSSVVLSAGLNRRLFRYFCDFEDFFPDEFGQLRKHIVLKVSDFRSAVVQGTLLARQGVWISEYRVESGLNCGGHAFGGKGKVLGPILAEFQRERGRLGEGLREVRDAALTALGRPTETDPQPPRVTVQGGIGTPQEDAMLRRHYQVDGTGWATPFLLVSEVTNLDPEHRRRLCEAGPDDVHLSGNSPLGIPFWSLKTSASEVVRRQRIAQGNPGSPCPKGFLVSNTEFTPVPICTASRAYQRRKLSEIAAADLPEAQRNAAWETVVDKACICHDLGGSVTVPHGIDPDATTAVCCGPNIVNFSREYTLAEMLDHIYGRHPLPMPPDRPHMFLRELALHLEQLRDDAAGNGAAAEARANLLEGIRHYRQDAAEIEADGMPRFLEALAALQAQLEVVDTPSR
jgi:hypothetical protein